MIAELARVIGELADHPASRDVRQHAAEQAAVAGISSLQLPIDDVLIVARTQDFLLPGGDH